MFEHPALDMPIEVYGQYEVCPTCQGEGRHVRNDLDQSKLVEDMEADGDWEGIEAYYKGAYDKTCATCQGERVILVPHLPSWAKKIIQAYEDDMYEHKQEVLAERRFGA